MASAHQIRAPQTIYPNDVPMNCAYCHRSLISIDYVECLVGCLHLRAVTFCSRNGVNDMLLSRKINSVASSFRYDARQNPRLEAPSSAKGMRGGLFWPVMENAMVPKILVVGTAITAIAAFAVVSQPVQARSCYAVLAKGRGLDEATASARSLKHLTNRINHRAAKNKLGTVGVGHRSTVCSNQGVPVCTSSAKVCG